MTEIKCPFCGNEHDTAVMDLSAHYAPYLQGLGVLPSDLRDLTPMRVQQAMKALRETTGLPQYTVRMKDLTDGWTGI